MHNSQFEIALGMRILHLTSHLRVGGIVSSILSLSQGLTQRGHDVRIASGGGPLESRARALGLPHRQVPLHTSVEFSVQVVAAERQLRRLLRDEPVDVLHAHTRVGQVVADRLSRRLTIPYVATWHGFFRVNLGRRWWPCTGDLTIAISEPVRQHLIQQMRVPASRIRLIPHGIDIDMFASPVSPSAQQQLRDQLRMRANGPVVGTVARLVASKGVDRLIRSLPQIRAAVPDASLLIVGDGEERSRLEQLAVAHGIQGAVHFAGALPETQIALSLMQVFVFLPTAQEGFGLSFLEAMASGCPIVAMRQGAGAQWVLEQIPISVIVEPEDLSGLATAVTRFLQHRDAARQAAERARTVVKAHYSLARMVDQVESVYQELVKL